MRRKVASSSFTSCRLAPLATSDSGTPRASTRRLRLRPFFSPIRGVRPHAFGCQRSLMHGPIDALPAPGDALHLVVFGESCLPQAEKKASALPSLKVCVNRAGTTEFTRQSLPLAARTQHINDGGKDLSGGNRLASRAGLSTILASVSPGDDGNKRLHSGPKHIRNCP